MNEEIWVLGATGRTGRLIAERLHRAGRSVVLVGRNAERLAALAAELATAEATDSRPPRIVAGSLEETLFQLTRSAPAVVVNTVGPFSTTAAQVAAACPPGTDYVDVANEMPASQAILDLDRAAAATNRTLVTGAGFGVFAVESILLHLSQGEPTPARVRVDALASVATEPGPLGAALASSILGGLPAGGRQVEGGRLVRSSVGGRATRLTTPDGDTVVTGSAPTSELLAAWKATSAGSVVAGSSMIPTGTAVRLAIPVASQIMRIPAVARFAVSRLARVQLKSAPMPTAHSWGHARVEWPSGRVREGWMRTGDGMDFTVAVAAEVALRLAQGQGRPGAFTPGSLFGPELVDAVGGEFVIEGEGVEGVEVADDEGQVRR